VAASDSGSDFSFDLLGNAKVIQQLKETLLSMWDRVVFYREFQASERMKLVGEALPLISDVNEMETSGKIGKEQAELLRRQISGNLDKFMQSGAIIPEMQERSHYEPRALLAPQPKYLTAGTSQNNDAPDSQGAAGSADTSKGHLDLEQLTEEQKADLLRRLQDGT